jgi:thioredoxin 1
MSDLLNLSDKNFNQIVQNNKDLPLLVDFWASWCPPCKMVEPVLEELAKEEAGKLIVAKINVDQNPKAAAAYEISGVPTFMIFRAGTLVSRRTGAQSKQQLKQMLAEVI